MSDNQYGMNSVLLLESALARRCLEDMLEAAIGSHGYILDYVSPELALLVIEAAKRAEDRDEWFPRGKWATVQAMEERVGIELNKMFKGGQR